MEIWHIWSIIALLFLIFEIFTPSFIAASIAIGCFCATLISLIGFGLKIELIIFSVGILISFFGVRPFMLKYAQSKNNIKTNTAALIGKVGKVITPINNFENTGRILVNGEDWKARSVDNEKIEIEQLIEVIEIDSTILVVKQTK